MQWHSLATPTHKDEEVHSKHLFLIFYQFRLKLHLSPVSKLQLLFLKAHSISLTYEAAREGRAEKPAPYTSELTPHCLSPTMLSLSPSPSLATWLNKVRTYLPNFLPSGQP